MILSLWLLQKKLEIHVLLTIRIAVLFKCIPTLLWKSAKNISKN